MVYTYRFIDVWVLQHPPQLIQTTCRYADAIVSNANECHDTVRSSRINVINRGVTNDPLLAMGHPTYFVTSGWAASGASEQFCRKASDLVAVVRASPYFPLVVKDQRRTSIENIRRLTSWEFVSLATSR